MSTWAGFFNRPNLDHEETISTMSTYNEAMGVSPNCNTFTTTGFHLDDLTRLRNSVYEAVRLHAQGDSVSMFPGIFQCSHCGMPHAVNPEEVRNALFNGPGAGDFPATYDELLAILGGTEVAAAGAGSANATSINSDVEISEILDPKEVFEDNEGLTPDVIKENVTAQEAAVNDEISKGGK